MSIRSLLSCGMLAAALQAWLILGSGGNVLAAETEAPCSSHPPALPAAFASWERPSPLVAARTAGSLAQAALVVGQTVGLQLAPTSQVAYVLPPFKPGAATSSGGMALLTVAVAGTYRIAIGERAWIDVARDGKSVDSVAHARGPACSGIGKMVDFALIPGRYVIEFSGSSRPVVLVLVIKAGPARE